MGTVGSGADGIVAAVVIGGGPVRAPDGALARRFDVVVAADSGLDVALTAGLRPTHLVGDLDSISSAGAEWAAAHGVPVEQHPTDKDATDTAIALDLARRLGATEIVLFGGVGIDRFDHLLGTVAALGDPGLAAVPTLTAHLGASTLHVLHPGHAVSVDLPAGAVFSLVALHGGCTGVAVRGATWPLDDAVLPSGSTRGISNTAVGSLVQVSTASGVLTVVGSPVQVSTASGVLTVVVPRPDPGSSPEHPQHPSPQHPSTQHPSTQQHSTQQHSTQQHSPQEHP